MPRPASFSDSDLLDAAVALAAAGGPRAVTMVAVARSLSAPSGSIYHRVSGRPALLARVWSAAVHSFEAHWWAAAATATDPGEVAVVPMQWAAEEPELAALLARHRRADFIGDANVGAALREHEARLVERLVVLSERFCGSAEPANLDRTRFALATVPLAAIRDGSPQDLVAATARALLEKR